MATFLFDEIIFGPVNSRRLGVSLGINLLPTNYKICNFNCIYCECGLNKDLGSKSIKQDLPSRNEVKKMLAEKIKSMQKEKNLVPDVITFAGNGEPSLHPDFEAIIDDTIKIRNQHCPNAKIAVLTNATLINKKNVFNALLKVDQNIIKLDSVFDHTLQALNKPLASYSVSKQIELMKEFKGNCIIQTMFTRGQHEGNSFDNTKKIEVDSLIEAYLQIAPKQIMIYTISRDTPIDTIEKIGEDELNSIGAKIKSKGFDVQISY